MSDLRAELHRLVDELDEAKLPAALASLSHEYERPALTADETLAALADLPGGLPPDELVKAKAALGGEHPPRT